MSVGVVTPTIGTKYLKDAIESVQDQTYQNITHYIVYDGKEHYHKIERILESIPRQKNIQRILLDENIGNGWWGHRTYAASAYITNTRYTALLDEDNWYYPNHIETLVQTIEENPGSWAYSLRNIHNEDGTYEQPDNSSSLGKYPSWHGTHLVDTSCYLIPREQLVHTSKAWYAGFGADRNFYQEQAKEYPEHHTTGQHTLAYRNTKPDEYEYKTSDYIKDGNNIQYQKYKGDYPWKKKTT